MRFFTSILFFLISASALAAPVSMFADEEWTIVGLLRSCDEADTSCVWTFSIDTGAADATPCSLTVKSSGDTPASQANGGPATCGIYTVISGWSGQFGADEGFTTLSVVDYARGVIVYPAYTDKQVAGGEVVTPDQSYPVQALAK